MDYYEKQKRKKRRIPRSQQVPTDNPAHMGVPRNLQIANRKYFVPEPPVVSLSEDGILDGTLFRIGRPLIIDTPEQIESAFCCYVVKAIEMNKPITTSSFCAFIGISRDQLYQYSNNIIYSDTLKRIFTMIESNIVDKSLDSTYQHQIAQLLLKNFHGFKDKVEITSNNTNLDVTAMNREDIIKAVEQARKDKQTDK